MTDRIVITRPLPGDPIERFARAGFTDVWMNPRDERLPRAELLDAVGGAAAVVINPTDHLISDRFFAAAGRQLRVVSEFAVGVDNIDLAAAARHGVLVGHTPHAVTEPTADVAWLLMLAAARRAAAGLDLVRSGAWVGFRPSDPSGRRVTGKTLLIVGPGRIGHATARRGLGWNMSILYHARSDHPEFESPPLNARRVSLEAGLAEADFVSIHTPLTEQTRHLIDAEQLALMKPTAVLVNTARGPIVDEAALAAALRSGTIFAAGLDVYEQEPAVHPDLLELKNVFLLPHWGSTADEDRDWMMRIAVDNAIAGVRGEKMPHEYPRSDSGT